MNWNRIESRQNPLVKLCASLSEKKVREREGFFLAEGMTLFLDLCEKGILPEKVLVSEKAMHLTDAVEARLEGSASETFVLSAPAFERVTSEKGSEGIVSVFSLVRLQEKIKPVSCRRLVALENLQDPGNVGTVLRSAAAFGFDAVLTVGGADPFSAKAIRASMGAVGSVPVISFPDTASLMDWLEEKGIHSVAACLRTDSVPIEEANLSEPVCVLIGNEGKGLSEEAMTKSCERCIIPISGMESLNAAAAATVFLWEIKRRGGEA